MKKREQYLDTLRCLACLLVVLTHSVPPLQSSGQSSIHAFASFISSPSSELFLAISGALLLPVRRPTGEFLRKRFTRVFPPLIFWSIVVVVYRYLTHEISANEAWTTFLYIPIKPVIGVYWFFYVISGLYVFAPFISKWLLQATKKEMHLYLSLWAVTLSLASASILLKTELIDINGNYYFILNSFGGFLGFMLLGHYLRNYTGERTRKKNILVPLLILSALLMVAVIGYKTRTVGVDFFIENLSLVTALMVYSLFMLFKGLHVKNKAGAKLISEMALCSYGIYLIHIFIARTIVWGFLEEIGWMTINPTVLVAVCLILSLVLSYLVVRLVKFIPYSKYVIG